MPQRDPERYTQGDETALCVSVAVNALCYEETVLFVVEWAIKKLWKNM